MLTDRESNSTPVPSKFVVSELLIRVIHIETANYRHLDIEQTLPFWTLSYVRTGEVRTTDGSTVIDGGLIVHRPNERFSERASGLGCHFFILLELVGVESIEQLPETLRLVHPEAYESEFLRVQEGEILAVATLLTMAIDSFAASERPGRPIRKVGRFDAQMALMRNRAVTRRELAESAGLDPNHFDRVFRATYGESPMVLARRFRLDRLRRDLLADDAPLEAIANRHGFSEASSLIRFFLRMEGISPSVFRERAKRSVGRYIESFDGSVDDANLIE